MLLFSVISLLSEFGDTLFDMILLVPSWKILFSILFCGVVLVRASLILSTFLVPDSQSGPLVATLACPPAVIAEMASEQMSTVTTLVHPSISSPSATMDQSQTVTTNAASHSISTSDPVTKAVVDNIVGNLPTKKPQMKLSCDICNIQVLGQNIMEEHLAGAKHARKVKSLELMKEMQSMISNSNSTCLDLKNNTYTCKPCNVIVNSIQQLQIHCQGSKHKSKVTGENGGITNGEIQKGILARPCTTHQSPMPLRADLQLCRSIHQNGDAMSSRFYCSTCNVRVNSDTQLEQHRMSKKHSGKASGVTDQSNRSAPYFKNQRKVFVREGWIGNPVAGPYQSSGGGGSLRCNVCDVSANSALQLQQHNYSKKHQDKLLQKGGEPMDTNQHQPPLQAPPFIKKQWIGPQNDIGSPYSYGGHGGTGGSGGNYNVYPKWSAPAFQRSQPGGYNRY